MLLDRTIRYGLILLLIWTPLAFGSVHAWAYALLEVHAFLLVAAWMGQRLIAQLQPTRTMQGPSAFVWTPLVLPLMLFGTLLLFQLLPLTSGVLTWLSPATADLYHLFRPGWPKTHVPLSLD